MGFAGTPLLKNLVPSDIVLDGVDPAPHKKGHSSPHFSAHVYCGQKAGIPLGTEVGLVPGHIVLDGDSAHPTEKGTAAPPHFSASFPLVQSPISTTTELLFH